MVDTVGLGFFLREKRKAHKFTQQDVADVIDITERALSNIENGKSEPELDTVLKLCDLYGVLGNEIVRYYKRSSEMEYAIEILSKAHMKAEKELFISEV